MYGLVSDAYHSLAVAIFHQVVQSGKKGVGLGKRAPSPSGMERIAKAAKLAEESDQESFRDRTRREFEERRAEARLINATRTLLTIEETAGEPVSAVSGWCMSLHGILSHAACSSSISYHSIPTISRRVHLNSWNSWEKKCLKLPRDNSPAIFMRRLACDDGCIWMLSNHFIWIKRMTINTYQRYR